ncbi:DUF6316 family protein [Pseudomonas oryzihabitans]|uniref:DUF6316 family protein n=1 Tax=Pseudomonas oryzihabitans TaxID=47885 RepID=UPI0011A963F2|nr:DUF6316 family protein [Pseudomonas psychrotolerans]
MFGKRNDDPGSSTHFRSERVSVVNGQFFFTTREGTLEGPFFSREEALNQIDRYVERLQTSSGLLRQSVSNL